MQMGNSDNCMSICGGQGDGSNIGTIVEQEDSTRIVERCSEYLHALVIQCSSRVSTPTLERSGH